MKLLAIIILIPVLCGCATYSVWSSNSYREQFDQFLITQDGATLIILGDRYHYVFSDTRELASLLESKHSRLLSADFGDDFITNIKNEVSGSFMVICDCIDSPASTKTWLLSNGFIESIKENSCGIRDKKYSKKIVISGTRYLPNEQAVTETKNLNNTYAVHIVEDWKQTGTASKIALTPIAVTVDGIYTYGALSIAVALWPLTAYNIISSISQDENAAEECHG